MADELYLMAHEIKLNDIDEFMKLFGNRNEQQILEKHKNELKILNEKNNVVGQSIRMNNEISDIREKLDYCSRVSEIG
ncbi:unnamed protein product [Didymodactylos carnosus]|uniref:Uncharacterized protein n=1 Tax=Didymodactylos carnosus TaxID=1234261 RepID=A0A815GFR3_9BILA|nr:unnamed protein product [Didymodactylos carnosus]CAF4198273.1 unnamed protein product [Didymodactylos carnosus]